MKMGIRRILILTVSIVALSNLSFAKLNFKCPNAVPEGVPPPSKDVNDLKGQFKDTCKDGNCALNGISANLDPSKFESQGEYAQYQAAKALVPCDETPIGVFIPSTQVKSQNSPVDRHSVAITYSAAPITDEQKQWLEDALRGCGYGNAVQKALEEKGVKADYDLDGDDILDALCPKPKAPAPPPVPCQGGSIEETRECCSVLNPCVEGAGDCDEDDECAGDLVCGKNNCGDKFTWASADCCEKKDEDDEEPKQIQEEPLYYRSYASPTTPAPTTTPAPKTTPAATTTEAPTTTEEPKESYGEEELPTGWAKVYDSPSGRFYYIDHINQRTQWENPSSGYAPPATAGARSRRDADPSEPSLGQRFMSFIGNLLPAREYVKRDSPHHAHHQPAPTPGPIYYKPLPTEYKPEPAYKPEPVYQEPEPVYKPEPVYQEPEPVYKPEPAYQEPEPVYKPEPTYHQPEPAYHQPAYPSVDCYNPPEPKFIVRVRTIKDESCCKEGSEVELGVCQQLTDECEEMINEEETIVGADGNEKRVKRMVECEQFRFTDLNGDCADQAGYTDCVDDDENYLKETNFYASCENDEECFTNRRRPADDTNPLEEDRKDKNNKLSTFYPGYKEATQCEARKKRSLLDELVNRSKRDTSYYAPYPKHEPLFVKQVGQCRVIRAKGGDHHKRCDRIAETRPLTYQQAVELFPPGTDLSHDASDFDLLEF